MIAFLETHDHPMRAAQLLVSNAHILIAEADPPGRRQRTSEQNPEEEGAETEDSNEPPEEPVPSELEKHAKAGRRCVVEVSLWLPQAQLPSM